MSDSSLNLITIVAIATPFIIFAGGILAKITFAKKKDVYNEDGSTKFPVVAVCDRNHRHMCDALRKIESKLEAMDKSRNETRSEWTVAIQTLTHDVGVLQGKVSTLLKQ